MVREKPATKQPSPSPASPHAGNGGARLRGSSRETSRARPCPAVPLVQQSVTGTDLEGAENPLALLSPAAGPVQILRKDQVLPRLLWETRENSGHVLVEVYIKFLKFAFTEIFNALQQLINMVYLQNTCCFCMSN